MGNMVSEVFVKKYDGFDVNEPEVLRYAGCAGVSRDDEMYSLMSECIKEVNAPGVCSFSICYRIVPVTVTNENHVDFGMLETISNDLATCLKGCSEAVLLSATIGYGVDRIIGKYNRVNPAKALFVQAIGAERIETMLDAFCNDLPGIVCQITGRDNVAVRPRYSPGYGDLPLAIQPDFLRVTQAGNRIGITLNDSLLMAPSKSVTAIVGIVK